MITLFEQKDKCCACSACLNICPKQAIIMKSDGDGYAFPVINNDLCIECELCNKVCAFQNVPVSDDEPIASYVAINKNKSLLSNSASGGILGALASIIFEKKGVVFGCAYNEYIEPEHICVDNQSDIKKIQGSKYVQSNVKSSYSEAKEYLKSGKYVLFTGTPCQIAGLKSYLGKDYDNLITADLICHGVPSAEFFKGYVNHLEEKLRCKILDLKFRDKSKGWGLLGKVIYKKNGNIHEEFLSPISSYYYAYFLKGDIYRENCYECKYACANREGDFTMGDYWGIEKSHPEIETKNGVSVLLINSNEGMNLLDELTKYLDLTLTTLEQARAQNGQLNKPTGKSNERELILKTWREGGHQAVADEYYKLNKNRIWLFWIKSLMPLSAKKLVKTLMNIRFSS